MKSWKKITKSTLPKPNSFILLKNTGLSKYAVPYQVVRPDEESTLRGYLDNGWGYYLELPEFKAEKDEKPTKMDC